MSTKKDEIVCVKPFIKWAGGKGQLLNEIKSRYPKELGKTITKYAEPFLGGGAVLFDILSNYNMEKVYISDVNQELINTYTSIRDNVECLLKKLCNIQQEYLNMDDEYRKKYYYDKRELYNELKCNNGTNSIERAALFIFLNKTCFNGLYRVNKKGLFNVPMGNYKNPKICDSNNLRIISNLLKKVEIVNGDYTKSIDFIDDKTFVYFDPPYRPLNSTSSFTSYTENDFDDEEQKELSNYFSILDKKGAKIILSNSDPKNIDKDDDFFEKLYINYKIEKVNAKRVINSKAASRGEIKELLIYNF